MTDSTPRRPPGQQRNQELRLYGLNACLAAFQHRPEDLRKVYLVAERMPALRAVLAHCVSQRLGYRVVAAQDLDKLTSSTHHEGVCFEIRKPAPLPLSQLLARMPAGPHLLVWLDGVGNPHNLGAVLRSSAHFGVSGLLIPSSSGLSLSGSACRVAEGGAEKVPLVTIQDVESSLGLLEQAGFTLAATLPRDADSVYTTALPERLVWVFGAEQTGMSTALIKRCSLRVGIPGSGAVESLNIASAAAVMLSEWRRRHP